MKWFSNKVEIPKSSVSDEDIKTLNEKTTEIMRTVVKMERAVMDGEHQWMLVKCPPAQVPVCIPDKPVKQGDLKPCLQIQQ